MLSRLRQGLFALQSMPGSFHYQAEIHERQLMLMGRQAAWKLESRSVLPDLTAAEFRVFSQWGEDGIIEWLVQNLPIGNTSFVEFGVENYMEANTRFLIQHRNWRGLIMDGNPAHMDYVRSTPLYWKHDLDAVAAFVTRDNINDLLREHGYTGDIGLLSVDIDGNDYWVLEAIDVVRPAILVVEYNPILGDRQAVSVPYDAAFSRFDAHGSGLYFGASIEAMRRLAERKGYNLVGTCSNGINAFFVRSDLYPALAKKIAAVTIYPSRHRDSRDASGQLSFTAGMARLDLIRDMPVILVDSGDEVVMSTLEPLYSDAWTGRDARSRVVDAT